MSSKCTYCEMDGETFQLEDIAASVETIVRDFYDQTEAPEGRPLTQIISDLAETSWEVAEDIRSLLAEGDEKEKQSTSGEGRFSAGSHYIQNDRADSWDLRLRWRHFEKSLKIETRYFNRDAEALLASLFAGIGEYQSQWGKPIIVDAGPNSDLATLYRARVFQSERDLREAMKRPDLSVGPPPPAAASAGRMNATGIAVFYGATASEVAIAEVRPPVGSKVLVACFEVTRPLKLLDLVAMKDLSERTGSLFDEGHRDHLKQVAFLRELSSQLSKAVMPDDQIFDYLPTQAIADFLATSTDPSLDGIIYPSVQIGTDLRGTYRTLSGVPGGRRCNVVLFHKAARVLQLENSGPISVLDNSYFSIFPEFPASGPDVKYSVWSTDDDSSTGESEGSGDYSLKYESLEVHSVSAVTVTTSHSEIPRFHQPKENAPQS